MSSKLALVVEDSPTMRQLLVFALRRIPGLQTREAVDGVDALRQLETERPALILTDINMPVMDGLKLIETLRQREALADVPIVVITTDGHDADRERALAAGATVFIAKPIQASVVVRVVEELLAR